MVDVDRPGEGRGSVLPYRGCRCALAGHVVHINTRGSGIRPAQGINFFLYIAILSISRLVGSIVPSWSGFRFTRALLS